MIAFPSWPTRVETRFAGVLESRANMLRARISQFLAPLRATRIQRAGISIAFASAALVATACGGGGDAVQPTTVPSAPAGVHVTLLSLNSVRVDWTANAASEHVRSYNVFRNGNKIAEPTSPAFTDTGLSELETYRYTVSANGSGTLVSPASEATGSAAFTIPDLTAPRAMGATPANGATGIAISTAITVTFSEALTPGTVTGSSISLRATNGGAAVAGSVSYASGATTATFTPSAQLAYNTSYTLAVTTDVKDLSGNQLATPYSIAFTTAPFADNTPPTVVSILPAGNSTDVALNTAVAVTFSEPVVPATVNGASVSLTRSTGGTSVGATVSYNPATYTATLTPLVALENSAAYTVNISTAIKDTAGNALARNVTSTFTTVAFQDVNPPTVVSVSPANAAQNVALSTVAVVTFSEPMSAATVNALNVKLTSTASGASIATVVSYDAATNRANITPLAPLSAGTSYTVVVTTGVRDVAGNALVSAFTSTFTTLTPDVTPPVVLSNLPANGASGVSTFFAPTVTFSEALSAASVSLANIVVKDLTTGLVVPGVVQYVPGSSQVTFVANAAFNYATTFSVTVGTGVRDVAGNALASAFTYSFTTVSAPAVVSSVSPTNRATNVAAGAVVQVKFSVPVKPVSVSSSTFQLKNRTTGLDVPSTVMYDASSRVATLTPSSPLANNASFVVSVTPGITDQNDVPVAAFQSCFTPGPGTASATTITGFWSGDTACGDIHWHIRMVQTGNTLSLQPNCAPGDCQMAATNSDGLSELGGASFATILTLNGTVNGTAVNFTFTTTVGLTFTFVGAFATPPAGSPNPWIIGTISANGFPTVGLSLERQLP